MVNDSFYDLEITNSKLREHITKLRDALTQYVESDETHMNDPENDFLSKLSLMP